MVARKPTCALAVSVDINVTALVDAPTVRPTAVT
jgi:hypothetical protein